MRTVSPAYVSELIDFAPSAMARAYGFAESQLHGTVAACNMLARNGVAYLADEVGMGKTYVALAVMGVLRHQDPSSRIMIIAPRENIQRKWEKELRNFVRWNWRVEDNRFRNLHGGPVRQPVLCNRFEDLAAAVLPHDDCDPILRMTTFSASVKERVARQRLRGQLLGVAPWLAAQFRGRTSPGEFRDRYGRALNAIVPPLDLLIVDEGHNLRKGFGPNVANRNRLLGLALGHCGGDAGGCEWYGPRVKRLLVLSATPFETDYGEIHRQLDVLGFGDAELRSPDGERAGRLRDLADADFSEEQKQDMIRELLIRRVAYLRIAGEKWSKNMYRREWRQGGYREHDQPISITDQRQRLVLGLIQKKVSEVLGDRRFNNAFQIGMLSSFESFLESMAKSRKRRLRRTEANGNAEPEPVFDGSEQTEDVVERRGIDTSSLERVVETYRSRFGRSLPHPKLDTTADALAGSFDTGEKSLIFVRRVATVRELKQKLDQRFDQWLCQRMRARAPELATEIDGLFDRYRKESARRDDSEDVTFADDSELRPGLVEDEGATDTFFAWFFRGSGPGGVLSGAAMHKNRFASTSTIYSTFFDDDYVSWLLGRPPDPLAAMAGSLGVSPSDLARRLRGLAFANYRRRSSQRQRFPRLYVFEAYQAAGLALLASGPEPRATRARIVLEQRFSHRQEQTEEPPEAFPAPLAGIGITTFITQLVKRDSLRAELWPREEGEDFVESFRRREQRRELLSAMSRLGASYIDLYMTAIAGIGSFAMNTQPDTDSSVEALARDYLDLLERQRGEEGFHAYAELSAAARAFDSILAINLPGMHQERLEILPVHIARVLQQQVPVGGMSGGVNHRLVQQFRMPGFPLLLVTTDVLQEGEDLHTFCRRVIHYGIAWTPSAVEQRTGRIDRIGSLAQRTLEGRAQRPEPSELIQVHYPHLQDTVEVLQVRRVLRRLNEFLRLSHRELVVRTDGESRISIDREIHERLGDIPRVEQLLESAFPVRESELRGELTPADVRRPDIGTAERMLERWWGRLREELGVEEFRKPSRRLFEGVLTLNGSPGSTPRTQHFSLALRSQVVGDEILLRCESMVGEVDLDDADLLDRLYDLQRDLGVAKVCTLPRGRGGDLLFVRGSCLVHPATTQEEEVFDLVQRVVGAADRIEAELLGVDAEPGGFTEEGSDA